MAVEGVVVVGIEVEPGFGLGIGSAFVLASDSTAFGLATFASYWP